jgi:pimeloyl-ACP methyl ester carboxylesterase
MFFRQPFLIVAVALGFVGCAQYATVRERRALYHPVPTTVSGLRTLEHDLSVAYKIERSQPMAALYEYLQTAKAAAEQLKQHPDDQPARHIYNFSVARIFTTIRDGKLDPWTTPLKVTGPEGDLYLTYKPDRRKYWNPIYYDFTPADQFDVHGTYVTQDVKKEGLGAPIVSVGREKRTDTTENFVAAQTFYGVTAVARFQGNRVTIEFVDPLGAETTTMDGHTYPLAADYTVPTAVMLARENPKKLELTRLLRPGKYAETAHVVRLQPWDPNKTVVLVVHGLMDSPATWTPMINYLRGDPAIRQYYQFWYYSYPSGYPYMYSAAILRHELDGIERRFPLRHKMVVIGHSMGGMISRLMITDSGDTIWMKTFGKPPEQTTFSPDTKEKLTDSLIFRHRSEVGRVIFISAPHRGSDLASNWLGRIGSSLVRSPVLLLKIGAEVKGALAQDTTALHLNRMPNSIDTLSPSNRFVKVVNTIPITPGIPYHSIIGDRGRGDTPNSSDGVVPYWSSHLDGAQSELIVPSAHPAHQNPKAIAEVRRILLLNAGIRSKGEPVYPEHKTARN